MRRLLTSLLAGTLALFVAAGQAGASAVDPAVLDQAMTHVAESSAVAAALLDQVEQDGFGAPGLDRAQGAVATMVARYASDGLPGLGTVTAEAIIDALLAGELPPVNQDGLAAALTEIEDAADAMTDEGMESEEGTEPDDDPGASGYAPGQSDNPPPGQGGAVPGLEDKDGTPPGQQDEFSEDETSSDVDGELPGASEETPASTRPTRPESDE